MIRLTHSSGGRFFRAVWSRQTVTRTKSFEFRSDRLAGVEGDHTVASLDLGNREQFHDTLELGLFPLADPGMEDADNHQ